MDKDVMYFIDDVFSRAGVEISVYTKSGDFACGKENFGENLFDETPTEVFSNQEKGVTCFPVYIKNTEYVGALKGATDFERKLASLIGELSKGFHAKETSLSKEGFCKQLIFGTVNAFTAKQDFIKYGIKDMPSYAMVLSVDKKYLGDVLELLNNYGEDGTEFAVKIDQDTLVLVKFVEEKQRNFHSPTEYAEFLVNSIFEEMKIYVDVCIGSTVPSVFDLNLSYEQAIATQRMSKLVNASGQVHSFKEFVFIKLIEDMPKRKLGENFEFLLDSGAKEIFEDAEMVLTAEEFLNNNLNSSETARKLFLHRNTLTYRLDKIERLTGLDIRKFSDAITFRLISIINRLTR